ncbi:hypothetical protein GCM10018793_69400 [Streptomyces sulfonofaciens]|uniref:Uncharacterized protein n=2 Tax=Streptomyces sulfonofaciens TaxID=68272 RepID=A0A919LAC3_9ACTN|nr:hypothetical protein GCM10018793_69400 [Streptomyces sulfonofaciens]
MTAEDMENAPEIPTAPAPDTGTPLPARRRPPPPNSVFRLRGTLALSRATPRRCRRHA